MVKTNFKSLKKLAVFGAITTLCGFAKSETRLDGIEDVILCDNGTMIVKKDVNAQIDGVKTPWMFARSDAQSAFANNFTSNATEVVVDETGTNVYANAEGKITHFTLSNGVPSKTGKEYGLMHTDGSTTNTIAKVVAAKGNNLYTVDQDDSRIRTFTKVKETTHFMQNLAYCGNAGQQIDTYFDGTNICVLGKNCYDVFNINESKLKSAHTPKSNEGQPTKILSVAGTVYCGDDKGYINGTETTLDTISGLSVSTNGNILASSTNTTKYVEFCPTDCTKNHSVELGVHGIKKVIDNRSKGGKLMYVTRSGFGIAD